MVKGISLIIICCFFASCSSNESSKASDNPNPDIAIELDSINKPEGKKSLDENPEGTLDLPILGTFDLTNMPIDQTNEYGGGDCFGKTTKYSLPDGTLAVDSMSCGDYGYTYTYYLLDPEDLIQVVFTRKSEPFLTKENNYDGYLIKEQIIDFNSEPSISMSRTNKFPDLTNQAIDKPFENETLEDRETAYQYWEQQYLGHW